MVVALGDLVVVERVLPFVWPLVVAGVGLRTWFVTSDILMSGQRRAA